jgi:hypothetical protein
MRSVSGLRRFYPDDYQQTVFRINYQKLAESGIKVLFFDLDNTLIPYDESTPSKAIKTLFQTIREVGLAVVIISNNHQGRVTRFAEILGVASIESARKPFKSGFKRALALFPGVLPSEVMVIGDQVMTDIYGAKRMGFHAILVDAINRETERWYTRINRWFERLTLKRIERKDPDYYHRLNLEKKE